MVRWAPLNIPYYRRRQTASILIWFFLLPFCLTLFTGILFTRSLTPFALAYLVFMFFDPSPETGGRKLMWVRNFSYFKWFRDYFPITLEKTVDLDPSKHYGNFLFPHLPSV
jgi:2-acylglycerol O-acyltransferase 2